jgi:ABC-type hemin transport system substrate-binding protein
MVMSSRYKGQLTEFATTFKDQKKELQFLTQQKVAVSTVKMSSNLETVAEEVKRISAFLEVKSEKEKEVDALVLKVGGTEAVIDVRLPLFFFIQEIVLREGSEREIPKRDRTNRW